VRACRPADDWFGTSAAQLFVVGGLVGAGRCVNRHRRVVAENVIARTGAVAGMEVRAADAAVLRLWGRPRCSQQPDGAPEEAGMCVCPPQ